MLTFFDERAFSDLSVYFDQMRIDYFRHRYGTPDDITGRTVDEVLDILGKNRVHFYGLPWIRPHIRDLLVWAQRETSFSAMFLKLREFMPREAFPSTIKEEQIQIRNHIREIWTASLVLLRHNSSRNEDLDMASFDQRYGPIVQKVLEERYVAPLREDEKEYLLIYTNYLRCALSFVPMRKCKTLLVYVCSALEGSNQFYSLGSGQTVLTQLRATFYEAETGRFPHQKNVKRKTIEKEVEKKEEREEEKENEKENEPEEMEFVRSKGSYLGKKKRELFLTKTV